MEQWRVFPDRQPRPGRLSREGILERLAKAKRGLGPAADAGVCEAGPARSSSGTPAAVLIPLVDRPDGFTVLMTRRTEHLHHHGGQICFPGGRTEAGDADAVATALRETAEEIGLDADRIEPIGHLDDYTTITGFIVTPVIAVVRPPFELTLDPHEVAYVFEVPLDFVLDPANHQQLPPAAHPMKQPRATFAMPYGDHFIWGATAGMLMNLYRVLALQ
ncbi:MAG: CoA pyrophosphatase [Alphaproteobacteria bacterium]|nr:CoA pyrophosphatase [Alphaproteobacteria bacterium]